MGREMYRKYIKPIFRRLVRNRIYTVINIAGLAIALTAVLLIYTHVVKEWKTDRFHRNGKHIYRLIMKPDYSTEWSSWTSAPTAPYTQAEFPAIKNYVRVYQPESWLLKKVGDPASSGKIRCLYTDKSFFQVFSFPFVSGKLEENEAPDWVVLTEKAASRYFGGKDPMGEILVLKSSLQEEDKGREFHVVGIVRDFPAASTLQADVIADFSYAERTRFDSWGMHGVYTYFQLEPGADVSQIEAGIPRIVEKNYSWIKASERKAALQPLQDIYFYSGHVREDMPHGSKRWNVLLCGITLLILILASCNYLLIKIARLSRNVTGLAVRRCFGAGNGDLRWQMFLETGLHVGIALLLTGVLTSFLHPYFIRIISPRFPYAFAFSLGEAFCFLLLLFFFVGGMAVLLSFYMRKRLNHSGIPTALRPPARGWDIRNVLSVVQICIFCTLLCCSVVLIRQMDFVRKKQLGFDTEHILRFGWYDRHLNMEVLRTELMRHADILSVSNGAELPLMGEDPEILSSVQDPENGIEAYMIHGDAFFADAYRIRITEGRNIDPASYPADLEKFFEVRSGKCPEILVNRKFVGQLGLKNPLGAVLRQKNGHFRFRIVGIVDDFHFLPLYESVKPMYIVYDMPFISASVVLRYREGKRAEVTEYLEKCYKEKFQQAVFSYQEYDYSRIYEKDLALAKLIHGFTLIAVLISGMGILAFSMFMAESRKKEVALRKVNGAGEWQIIGLLNRDFIRRVLLAGGIGLPVAGYTMKKWLEGFAYKAEPDIGVYVFVLAVSVILVSAIITWQVWKAATVNPMDVLRGE